MYMHITLENSVVAVLLFSCTCSTCYICMYCTCVWGIVLFCESYLYRNLWFQCLEITRTFLMHQLPKFPLREYIQVIVPEIHPEIMHIVAWGWSIMTDVMCRSGAWRILNMQAEHAYVYVHIHNVYIHVYLYICELWPWVVQHTILNIPGCLWYAIRFCRSVKLSHLMYVFN